MFKNPTGSQTSTNPSEPKQIHTASSHRWTSSLSIDLHANVEMARSKPSSRVDQTMKFFELTILLGARKTTVWLHPIYSKLTLFFYIMRFIGLSCCCYGICTRCT